MRADAIENYERSFYPQGIGRHFSAILGSGSLKRYDARIAAPTVVIHGKADKLMRPSGGRAIAGAIPSARLVLFDGMGHDLPGTTLGRHHPANSMRRSLSSPKRGSRAFGRHG